MNFKVLEDLALAPPTFPSDALAGTLFGDYIEAFKDKNETCNAFHFVELLTATSALVGRNIAIDIGQLLYPNFYSVLVGEPGVSRKTTSVSRAKRLVTKNDYTVYIDTDIASAEGFKEAWCDSEEPRALLALSELQRILIINKRQGTSNILPLLTDVYDNPDEITHKKAGNQHSLEEPFLTVLGGITPGLLEKQFTYDDFSSGFMSRLNFYVAETVDRHPQLEKPGEQIQSVRDKLGKLTTGKRVYTFNTKTEKLYNSWYKKLDHLSETNELIQQCSVRLEIQVPKLACILCWMRDGRNINQKDWAAARAVGDYWMATSRFLFSDFAANADVREQNLIIDFLKKQPDGQATSNNLFQALKRKMSSKRRNEILYAMTLEGVVRRITHETGGRPKTIYQLSEDCF